MKLESGGCPLSSAQKIPWIAFGKEYTYRLNQSLKEAEKEDRPFCFVLYPEGTLVSQNTRPISKKFADKMGIVRRQRNLLHGYLYLPLPKSDMKHQLLPRSTGLHYSLRSLAPRIPDLHLLDMTVNYPG